MNRNNLSFSSMCLDYIRKNNLLSECDTVVVGVSGGADSSCLLNVLFNLKEALGISIVAVHVNHGIRGAEAQRDEDFVRDMCENLGVPLKLFKYDCIDESKKTGESLEEAGRRLRYNAFNSVVKGENYKIATAHNANDNAETVLFNISRGSSLKGAVGIPVKRDNIIRPLLFAERSEIEEYCNENNISYVTDSTNNCDDYSRNKIRHNVLPFLKEVNPKAVKSILRFTENISKDSLYLDDVAENALKSARTGKNEYSAEVLKSFEYPILSRCIIKAVKCYCSQTPDSKKIGELITLLESGGKLQLYKDCFCIAENNKLYFSDCKQTKTEKQPQINVAFNNGSIGFGDYIINLEKYSKKINEKVLDNLIDCDKISGIPVLRTRLPGDCFSLPRRNVKKSLKKLFNEMAIPVGERDEIPVIAIGNEVVWVYGIGVSEKYKPGNNSVNIFFVKGDII